MQLLRNDMRLSSFSAALDLCGLAALLEEKTDVTVFAPTNLAFSRLEDGKLLEWFRHPQRLGDVLRHHIVSGRFVVRDLIRMRTFRTFGGGIVHIEALTDSVRVGEASIEKCDKSARNGMLHLVDRVLRPAGPTVHEPESPRA